MDERLASLELQGYKTFAKQSSLRFPAKITAIIGPNGSGKSNIADGVRWVLGEQSYSVLRAKKTEDMIYAGSESRSRSGMASVSIVFNNASGWLPIDYAEVVLTRRAYRDGQNEYLLNGQRVRLKDFHELLGKTGLGDRTYTIIGQGLVDLALSIKPDERRKLFEEAAGIGIYRSRKEEALRRLESSERNLERATDILDEIKPRLRSLERQAARFNEYQVVQENLQKNLRDWYGFHWYKAQEEIASTRQALEKAELESGNAQSKNQAAQASLQALRERISEKRGQVNRLHEAMQALHQEMQVKNQQLAILEERNQAIARSILQMESDRSTLSELSLSDEKTVEHLREEIQKLQADLKLAEAAKLKARDEMTGVEKAREALDRERRAKQSELIELEKELLVSRSKLQNSNDRVETLAASTKANQESLEQLTLESEAVRVTLAEAENALTDFEKDSQSLREQRAGLNEESQALQKQSEQNLSQVNKLNVEKNKLANRLDLLNQSQASLAGYSEGAKALLKIGATRKDLQLGDLASKLEIPKEYETAIAAALGDALDLLVMSSQDALPALAKSVQERVALTPREWPSDLKPTKAVNGTGIIGLASSLVGKPEGLESVIQRLLGKYLVIESISDAPAIQKKHPEFDLVSLKGEVLLQNGVAYLGEVKTSGKVSYLRTRRELEKELASTEAEFEKTNEINQALEKQSEGLRERYKALGDEEGKLQTKLSAAADRRNKASLQLDKLENQISWLTSQIEKNAAENELLARSHKDLNQALAEKTGEVEAATKVLSDLRGKLNAQNIDLLRRAFSDSETEHKVLNQRLSLRQLNLAEAEERMKADKARLDSLGKRLQDSETNSGGNTTEIRALREAITKLNDEASQLQSHELGPEQKSLKALEAELDQLQAGEGEAQKDLSNRERLVTHFQLELARQQEKLNGLRARIDDDFGLIELEYRNAYAKSTPLPFPDLVIETLTDVAALPENIDEDIREQKAQIRRMGAVNVEAQTEYEEVKERHTDLTTQIKDLNAAIQDINNLVSELDGIMRKEFTTTFTAVAAEFSRMFARLFNGGSAKLILSDTDDPIEGGIEIEARLPGKREQGLVLLSGGERSLTAVALVFALLKISPTPFCILDEVDAMLDESNVGRFIDLLKDLSQETQFILITHNRNTVQAADVIYGITMGKDGASQLMSLRLDEVDESFLK